MAEKQVTWADPSTVRRYELEIAQLQEALVIARVALAKADAKVSQLTREQCEITSALGFDGQLAPVLHTNLLIRARRLRAQAKKEFRHD